MQDIQLTLFEKYLDSASLTLLLFVHRDGRISAHGGLVDLRAELPTILLDHLRHQLEIVDIVSRREGVEEPRLFVERIGECVRGSHGDSHIIPGLGVDVGLGLLQAGGVEADCAFGDEEGLVVHLMPMRRGAAIVGRDDDLGGTETIVYVGESGKRLRKTKEGEDIQRGEFGRICYLCETHPP